MAFFFFFFFFFFIISISDTTTILCFIPVVDASITHRWNTPCLSKLDLVADVFF